MHPRAKARHRSDCLVSEFGPLARHVVQRAHAGRACDGRTAIHRRAGSAAERARDHRAPCSPTKKLAAWPASHQWRGARSSAGAWRDFGLENRSVPARRDNPRDCLSASTVGFSAQARRPSVNESMPPIIEAAHPAIRTASGAEARASPTNASVTEARKPGRISSSRSTAPCSSATAATRLSPRPLPGVVRLWSSR